ncbi:hypothetical protein [Sphingomonas lenta]|uniref:Uncharacterized protein n=1 Tax=Sphingomonas lenta TaxID=1141887 RepID=A0A2A2SEL6_9SPHN|nr:hypothetical protein [Sphingomonas lenta]PAX07688.1 hypothetical protein CKY28_08570 [Sphingomonas lenta]
MADGLVTGWKLDRAEREELLRRFPPRWPDLVADHVTLASRKAGPRPLPTDREGLIVGRVDDGDGLQALVVEIGGTTDRPDGSTYHVTWSLDRARGRTAVQSNEVLARLGWEALPEPVPVTLIPARF